MKDLNIKLDDKDRQDINLIITQVNTSTRYLEQLSQSMQDWDSDKMKAYLNGCAAAVVESRLNLHLIRLDIVKKYNVPYDFISKDGELFSND